MLIPPQNVRAGSILPLHAPDVVDFGLEGLIHVEANFNEIREQLLNVTARVLGHKLPRPLDPLVQAGQAGFDERAPVPRSHDQAVLLAPVVAEVEAIYRILQGDIDDAQVVFADGIQQLMDECRLR